jgi:hypothetical protein
LGNFSVPTKTDARLTSIGELDARSLERSLQRFDRPLLQFIASLKSSNRIDRHLGRRSQFSNAQTQRCTCHAALDGQQNNHISVPISVESLDSMDYRNTVLISER